MLQGKLKAVERYLNKATYERDDLIECILLAMLTRHHALVLGPPGTAKSQTERLAIDCFEGSVFSNQLHLMSSLEDNFGPMDMKAFETEGDWLRKIDGYLPTADFAILEELDKAGPAVYSTLLTALNERKYKHGDEEIDIPLITVMANMNAMMDDPTGATFDRYQFRCVVDYLQSPSNFLSLMMHDPEEVERPDVITMDELQQAQQQVHAVKLGMDIATKMQQIREHLRAEGLTVSDRRFRWSVSALQAAAWLDGRDEVIQDDLVVLRHTLWLTPESRDTVEAAIATYSNPASKQLHEIDQSVMAISKAITDEHENHSARNRWALQANRTLSKSYKDLQDMEGRVQGRIEERRLNLLERIPEITTQVMLCTQMFLDNEDAARSAAMDVLTGSGS
jgi:MoxR-like ATPase